MNKLVLRFMILALKCLGDISYKLHGARVKPAVEIEALVYDITKELEK